MGPLVRWKAGVAALVAAVPVTAPVVAASPAPAASPWMTLAIEVTRTWERATG